MRRNGRFTGPQLKSAALFGVATAFMNLTFYLAIDRLHLGKGVAIEFIGPITVAALTTRTKRNAAALALATIGVVVLSGIEIDDEPLGLLFIFLAALCWALYIVIGAKVAQYDRGVAGLGVGLAIGAVLFAYQQWLIRNREREACFKAFLNNNWFGLVVFAGISVS